MASALLARRNNEPQWAAETKVYMRKPNKSNSTRPLPNPNPNPNPNPSPKFYPQDEYYDDHPPTTVAVSDDSSSFGRKPDRRPSGSSRYVSFNISGYSRSELRELKRRLIGELEQVRTLSSRLESREIDSSARSVGHSVSGAYGGGGGREVTSSAGLGSNGFLQAKKPFAAGSRPVVSPKGAKRLAAAPESEKLLSGMMTKCKQILTKLMKQKSSSWFNVPVDVVGMKLHDYNQIVKNPMDLGTVKKKITKGQYQDPLEFAADVRLTFNNALLYNPQGHMVHGFADNLLNLFENEFCSAYQKYAKQQEAILREEARRQEVSTWSRAPPVPHNTARADSVSAVSTPPPAMVPTFSPPSPAPAPAPAPVPVCSSPIDIEPQPQPQQLPQQQMQPQDRVISGRPVAARLPKPKAKDPHKRPMSLEEKEKLGEGLQSLPQEKMELVVQIVKRRNSDMVQDGDEIELDFEAMDPETLWELDRFVANCKKMMSKVRRQEAIANANHHPGSQQFLSSLPAQIAEEPPAEAGGETQNTSAGKRMKKGGDNTGGEEDVDIGEEMPSANYPSVEIEKDNAGSSSSSSDSDESSSSDSDSDSSSGSDTDDDDARSPVVGSKSSPGN